MRARGEWITKRMDKDGPSGGKIFEQGYECPVCGDISGHEYHCSEMERMAREIYDRSLEAMDRLEDLIKSENWGGMDWETAKNVGVSVKNFMTYMAVDEHTQRNLLISLLSERRSQLG